MVAGAARAAAVVDERLMFFCAYMAFIYMPWDFFVKPVARDAEAWFGFLLHGWAAKLTEPMHWAIYAAGAYGFWRMRTWMWPWAAVYAARSRFGMLVWNVVYVGGAARLARRRWSRSCRSAALTARAVARAAALRAAPRRRCASATASGR